MHGVTARVPPGAVRQVILDAVRAHVADAQTARNLAHVISGLGEDQISVLTEIVLDREIAPGELAVELSRLQRDHVRGTLTRGRQTVALYFPTATYREHIAGLDTLLRDAGYNVVIALGVVTGDAFEQGANVHFAGTVGTLSLLEAWDFVDLVVSPVLATELPPQARRVYVLHDIHDSPLGDTQTVREIAAKLQSYDYVYAPSPSAVDVFRHVIPLAPEERRTGRRVAIVPGGYMKLDRFAADFARHRVDANSLVYAPTVTGYGLDAVGTVATSGRDIVRVLLENADGHEVIFRPHPHSLRTDAVRQIVDEFRRHPRFTLDDNASSYAGTYGRSRLMVSDISGTAFTYALATLRPVVFCSFNDAELEAQYGGLRYVRDRREVGYVVHSLDELAATVRDLVSGAASDRRDVDAYRQRSLFNVGTAHDYFVRHCRDFIAGALAPGWLEA